MYNKSICRKEKRGYSHNNVNYIYPLIKHIIKNRININIKEIFSRNEKNERPNIILKYLGIQSTFFFMIYFYL